MAVYTVKQNFKSESNSVGLNNFSLMRFLEIIYIFLWLKRNENVESAISLCNSNPSSDVSL